MYEEKLGGGEGPAKLSTALLRQESITLENFKKLS